VKIDKIYSKNEMINMGADGAFPDALLLQIPINKIIGREPIPSDYLDEKGIVRKFQPGKKIKVPIEVEYNNGQFVLYGGNHRLRQAEINNQENIWAFVHCENIEEYVRVGKEI